MGEPLSINRQIITLILVNSHKIKQLVLTQVAPKFENGVSCKIQNGNIRIKSLYRLGIKKE